MRDMRRDSTPYKACVKEDIITFMHIGFIINIGYVNTFLILSMNIRCCAIPIELSITKYLRNYILKFLRTIKTF